MAATACHCLILSWLFLFTKYVKLSAWQQSKQPTFWFCIVTRTRDVIGQLNRYSLCILLKVDSDSFLNLWLLLMCSKYPQHTCTLHTTHGAISPTLVPTTLPNSHNLYKTIFKLQCINTTPSLNASSRLVMWHLIFLLAIALPEQAKDHPITLRSFPFRSFSFHLFLSRKRLWALHKMWVYSITGFLFLHQPHHLAACCFIFSSSVE